jgi:hypothetical protein
MESVPTNRLCVGHSNLQLGVLFAALEISLISVLRNAIEVEESAGGFLKHLEEGAIEGEVISARGKVVIASHRCINFHLAVTIQAGFTAGYHRTPRRAGRGIAANGELPGDWITVGSVDGEGSEEVCQIISNVINVLEGIRKLIVRGDAITGNEAI